MIFTRTGSSFEVKIETDSSDTTEHEHDDKPRTNIHTKRSLKDHKVRMMERSSIIVQFVTNGLQGN